MKIESNSQSHLYSSQIKSKENEENSSVTFQTILSTDKTNQNNESTKESTLDKLMADIMSLLRTGMTVSEVELLEELLRKLKDEIKEGNYSKNEVENMLKNIEKEIFELQKRVKGQVIIKNDEASVLKEEKPKDNLSIETSSFLERIEKALSELNDLKTGKEKKEDLDLNSNNSELLEMIREFKN